MARGSTISSPNAVVWRGVNAAVLGVAPISVPLHGERGKRMPHQRNMNASVSPAVRAHNKSHHSLLTVFYASQPDKSSPEEWFHYRRDPTTHAALAQPRRFGLFTWQLVNVLRNQSLSTHADIAHAVGEKYTMRVAPTPSFEGNVAQQIFSANVGTLNHQTKQMRPSSVGRVASRSDD